MALILPGTGTKMWTEQHDGTDSTHTDDEQVQGTVSLLWDGAHWTPVTSALPLPVSTARAFSGGAGGIVTAGGSYSTGDQVGAAVDLSSIGTAGVVPVESAVVKDPSSNLLVASLEVWIVQGGPTLAGDLSTFDVEGFSVAAVLKDWDAFDVASGRIFMAKAPLPNLVLTGAPEAVLRTSAGVTIPSSTSIEVGVGVIA